jgi:hypothetical protein
MRVHLSDRLEEALSIEVVTSGRSRQQIILDALSAHLGTSRADELVPTRVALVPAEVPYRSSSNRLTLPPGVSTLDLLQRDGTD